jgi:hypothetical protein
MRLRWSLNALCAPLLALLSGCSGFAPGKETEEDVGSVSSALLGGPTVVTGLTGGFPPDTIGEVGAQHFLQSVNATPFGILNKGDTSFTATGDMSNLWTTGACATDGAGDPVIAYDHLADRWLLAQFVSFPGTMVCLAVSRTGVPTTNGADWFLYEITTPSFPDYPRIGVWEDAYYFTTYEGSVLGMYALDRNNLLTGNGGVTAITCQASGSQCLREEVSSLIGPNRDTRVLPADLDGPAPPAGTPGIFLRTVDDLQDNDFPQDRIELWHATVDWAAQTWTVAQQPNLIPNPFDTMACDRNGLPFIDDIQEPIRDCIPQPGEDTLDALSNRPMMTLRYRQFAGHASMVVNQTVDVADLFPVATGEVAGLRWYELRNSGPGWAIHDQGDFSPQDAPADDAELIHRWMGSAAMDQAGNIAIGYSAVNSDLDPGEELFPAIFYSGRLANDPPGTLSSETFVEESTGPATNPLGSAGTINTVRWGDYSAMSVDPIDDCTFWFTTHLANRTTRIVSFRFDECGAAENVCVLGESNVDLRDRTQVAAEVVAGSFLKLGAPATITGDARSGGNALIGNNGVVDGDLTLGGTLSTSGAFTITGTLSQNATPSIPSLLTKTFPVGAGAGSIAPNAVATLAPGNRGNFTIGANADVTLTTGTYNFASLDIQPDADLIISGDVELNVQGNLLFGDRSDVLGSGALTVYSNGSLVRIGTDATFVGILTAPNANLTVASRTEVDGCLGGENVLFETDVTVSSGGRTLPVGTPPAPSCTDGVQNGSETGVDCGGPDCPACPSGVVTATTSIFSDWGAGYCANLLVTNASSLPTTSWNVNLNLNGSIVTGSWNGSFSGNVGTISVGPGFGWNSVIAPSATNNSVGFCANRPSGAGTVSVISASGTF